MTCSDAAHGFTSEVEEKGAPGSFHLGFTIEMAGRGGRISTLGFKGVLAAALPV
jgi:hypothetical protein